MFLNDEILFEYKLEVLYIFFGVILYYIIFKVLWDWVIFLFILYIIVFVLFIVCFYYENIVLVILDLIVDWFFFVDIGLNFYISYVGKDGEMIDNLKMI